MRSCVRSGFKYAKHSDEPLKQKTLGVGPSCFLGSHLTGINSPGQQTDSPGQTQGSLA